MSVAYIIGATGSLGAVASRVFLDSGWSLALGARSEDRLQALGDSLESRNRPPSDRVRWAGLNASDPAQVRSAFDRFASDLGPPDACLYLVGGYMGGRPAWDCPPEEWESMLDRHLFGPALVLAAAMRRMLDAGRGGVLVAVGAAAGVDPAVGKAPYGVAKAGLLHLIRTLAEEGRPARIRANALVPLFLDTEENRRALPKADSSRWTPLETAAGVLLWLCSDQAATVTGSVLRI